MWIMCVIKKQICDSALHHKIFTMRRIFAKLKNVTQEEEEEVFFAVKGDVMGQ